MAVPGSAVLESASALEAPAAAMSFVSCVLASKCSEGDLGVLLPLVPSSFNLLGLIFWRIEICGMRCYQSKGLPPPRHYRTSRNLQSPTPPTSSAT